MSGIKLAKIAKLDCVMVMILDLLICDLKNKLMVVPQIAEDEPQFSGCMQTDQQHHKQTHELNANRAGQHGAGEEEPEPPA